MRRAQSRDAVHREMFYFRKSLVPEDDKEEEEEEEDGASGGDTGHPRSHDHEYTLMNIDTIINGKVLYHALLHIPLYPQHTTLRTPV